MVAWRGAADGVPGADWPGKRRIVGHRPFSACHRGQCAPTGVRFFQKQEQKTGAACAFIQCIFCQYDGQKSAKNLKKHLPNMPAKPFRACRKPVRGGFSGFEACFKGKNVHFSDV
jgi:hypothetical protein